MKAKAYCPSHLTGFFKIYPNGSTGAGVNLAKGMTTEIKLMEDDKVIVYINGKKSNAPTSRRVIEKFRELTGKNFGVKVNHLTEVPIGYGLGMSGAGAFSLALALNKALGAGLSKLECREKAFWAEIEEGTGLGGVIAQTYPGMLIGGKPYPSMTGKQIPCKEKFVVCGFFKPMNTKEIIRGEKWIKKINKAGEKCMQVVWEKKTSEEFIRMSKWFAIETGLASPALQRVIDRFSKASMAMLGQTVFVLTNKPEKIERQMKKYTKRVLVSRIASKGAGELWS